MEDIRKERAVEAMKKKPFADRHAGLFDSNKIIYPFAALLSAVTAFGAFYEFTVYVTNPVLAALISTLFLALIEYLEGHISSQFFEEYYIGKAMSKLRIGKVSAPRLFFGSLIVLLGGLLSVVGAYYSSKRLSNIESGIKDTYSAQIDSVKNHHEALIGQLVNEAELFRSSNMVKEGKGTALRFNSTGSYNAMQEGIMQARKDMKQEIESLKKSELKDLFEGNTKTDFNAYAVAAWVLMLMVGKQLCHWFRHYYNYRSAIEAVGHEFYMQQKEAPAPTKRQTEPTPVKAPIKNNEPSLFKKMSNVAARIGERQSKEQPAKALPEPEKPHIEPVEPVADVVKNATTDSDADNFIKDIIAILSTNKDKSDKWLIKWSAALADSELNILTKEALAEKYSCSTQQIDKIRNTKKSMIEVIGKIESSKGVKLDNQKRQEAFEKFIQNLN